MPVASANPSGESAGRRRLLSASGLAMGLGLVAGYGALAAIAVRYLYPARPRGRVWRFVTRLDRLAPGASLVYRTPAGERVTVARRGGGAGAADFLALSSTCPHLGCQVHWQPQNERFFCPCHNGVFTPAGKAIEGPPAEAGQSLASYPLKVEGGLLFIEVPEPERELASAEGVEAPGGPPGPGHDPCLHERPRAGSAEPV
jgi:nitrite reductase/ring-hydroxylating ferredoxin subunit